MTYLLTKAGGGSFGWSMLLNHRHWPLFGLTSAATITLYRFTASTYALLRVGDFKRRRIGGAFLCQIFQGFRAACTSSYVC
jgi:hypothetical protein